MFKEEDVFTVIITAVYTFIITSFISGILIFIYRRHLRPTRIQAIPDG